MSAGGPPRVHVLLLNWNGWRDTVECLESVFGSDYPELRVIVCDNASTDDSLERIRAWADGRERADLSATPTGAARRASAAPIRYVEYGRDEALAGGRGHEDAPLVLVHTGGNLGYAAGNNVGLRYLLARGAPGYVWVLNNDTVVAPDALGLLVARAESAPDVGFVGGTLLQYQRPEHVETVGGGRVKRWAGFPTVTIRAEGAARGSRDAEVVRVDFITGACLLARVDTLARVGLIDERYFLYCEDTDWSLRVTAAGLRLAWEPRATVWHKGGGAVGHRSARHDYYIVKSSLLLVHRFSPWLLPAAFVYSLYRGFAPKVVRRQRARGAAVLRAYRDFVRQVRRGADRPITF